MNRQRSTRRSRDHCPFLSSAGRRFFVPTCGLMTSRAAAVKDGRRSAEPDMPPPPGHALTDASTASSWPGRMIGKKPETQPPFNGCYAPDLSKLKNQRRSCCIAIRRAAESSARSTTRAGELIVIRIRHCQPHPARYFRRHGIGDVVPRSAKASAAMYWGPTAMIKRPRDGLLFFRGGRDLHACVAYDVKRVVRFAKARSAAPAQPIRTKWRGTPLANPLRAGLSD